MLRIPGKSRSSGKIVLSCRQYEDSASEQKLWVIFLGPRGPQNHLLTAMAKAAA